MNKRVKEEFPPVEKITELTPRMKALVPVVRDEWLAAALSTKPMTADERTETIEQLALHYKSLGFAPPPLVVFVPSPLAARIVAAMIAAIGKFADKPKAGKPRIVEAENVTSAIAEALDDEALRVNGKTEENDPDFQCDPNRIWFHPFDYRGFAKRRGAEEKFLEMVRASQPAFNGGNQWGAWCAYPSFYRRVGLQIEGGWGKWDPYERLAKCSGPRVMNTAFCVVSDRPRTLLLDDMGRPHGDTTGFEIWADGSALYAHHGLWIPRWMVDHPEQITPDRIGKETNAELRRAMVERYGPGKYLNAVGAKILDMDSLTLEGSAPRCLMVDNLGEKWLVGTDGSTKRVYTMPVPRESSSCKDAHNRIAGMDESRIVAEA